MQFRIQVLHAHTLQPRLPIALFHGEKKRGSNFYNYKYLYLTVGVTAYTHNAASTLCDLSEKEARFIKAMWRETMYRYLYNNLDTLELRVGDCIHRKYVLLLEFRVLKLKILLPFSSHTVYM